MNKIYVVRETVDKPQLENYSVDKLYVFSTRDKAKNFLDKEYNKLLKEHNYCEEIQKATLEKIEQLRNEDTKKDLWFLEERLKIFKTSLEKDESSVTYEEADSSCLGEHVITCFYIAEEELDTEDDLIF